MSVSQDNWLLSNSTLSFLFLFLASARTSSYCNGGAVVLFLISGRCLQIKSWSTIFARGIWKIIFIRLRKFSFRLLIQKLNWNWVDFNDPFSVLNEIIMGLSFVICSWWWFFFFFLSHWEGFLFICYWLFVLLFWIGCLWPS